MFRKVLLLSAILAIGASVGIAPPANAGLSLGPHSTEALASADTVSIKSAQATPATDTAPTKAAPVVSSASTVSTAPIVRRTAPKRMAATAVSFIYPRSHAIIHGVTY